MARCISAVVLIAVLCFSLCPDAVAGPASRESELTVSMEAPDGYVEIRREDFPDYFAVVSKELAGIDRRLLRLYALQDEYAFVQQGDFERLTKTVCAVWILADRPLWPYTRTNIFSEAPKRPMTDRQRSLTAAQVTKRLADTDADASELFFCGVIEAGADYAVLGTLDTRNLVYSFGTLSKAPFAGAPAVKEMDGAFFGLHFNGEVTGTASPGKVFEEASAYMRKYGSTLVPIPAFHQEHAVEDALLLTYAAELWTQQGKLEKVAALLEEYMLPLSTLSPSKRLGMAVKIAEYHLALKEYKKGVAVLAPVLEATENELGPDAHSVASAHAVLFTLYTYAGDLEKAYEMSYSVLAMSEKFFGPLSEESVSLALSTAMLERMHNDSDEARRQIRQAFIRTVEIWYSTWATQAAELLSGLAQEEQKGSGVFWLKLALLIQMQADAPDAHEIKHVVGELTALLEESGQAEAAEYVWTRHLLPTEPGKPLCDDALVQGKELEFCREFERIAGQLQQLGRDSGRNVEERRQLREALELWMERVDSEL